MKRKEKQPDNTGDYVSLFKQRFMADRAAEWSGSLLPCVRCLGVKCKQNPLDAWVIQELISQVAPDLVIETGSHRGGSAILWATVLGQVSPGGRGISIDGSGP